MHLRYLTPLVYPSRYANRLQVIKMSEEFSRFTDSFLLYVRELRESTDKIFSQYQVSRPFKIKAIGTPAGFPRSFFFALRARRLVERESQTVWFLRDGLLAFWLTFLADLKTKNFFFEVHAFERLPKFIYRRIFKYTRGIITTNENKARGLEKYFGVSQEKILVALNGVDLDIFSNLPPPRTARIQLSLPINKKLVVYTGTPSEEKGIGVLLKAASLLAHDIQIVSVGGGKKDWATFKSDPNFEKIIWIPQVSHDKVSKYLAAADILVAPFSGQSSWTTLYTSPLKIPEYLASGRTIVISNLPSIREFVSENEVFFFEADDAEDLVRAIRQALSNPEIMLQKGNAARLKAREFSWEKRAKRILEYISTILEK